MTGIASYSSGEWLGSRAKLSIVRNGDLPGNKQVARCGRWQEYVVPAQAGIQRSASDDRVPACAGMTDNWEAHS